MILNKKSAILNILSGTKPPMVSLLEPSITWALANLLPKYFIFLSPNDTVSMVSQVSIVT
jgi:hypothetical protein